MPSSLYDIDVLDSVFSEDQRKQYWDYIENQKWHVSWNPGNYDYQDYDFIPSKDRNWRKYDPVRTMPSMHMPRAVFASDVHSLEKNHPVLLDLWNNINSALGNAFEIAGDPEDMPSNRLGEDHWTAPATEDQSLEQGWRVYGNAQPSETIKRSHGVHRDCIDLNQDRHYTCLYFANLVWYPSWFAENIFYPTDTSTGDAQQFQGVYHFNQNRGFNLGWADEGKIVSPKPGRILIYDSRNLHTTKPTAAWAKTMRKAIAFRLRKKQ